MPEQNGDAGVQVDLKRRLHFLDMINRLAGAALMAEDDEERRAIYAGQQRTLEEIGAKAPTRARISVVVEQVVKAVCDLADRPVKPDV